MRRSIIAAVALFFVMSVPVAQAASMTIDRVVSPTGQETANGVPSTHNQTTWHVGLFGINGWDYSLCSSTASYPDSGAAGSHTVHGKETDPNSPWDSWFFTAKTPGSWVDSTLNFLPLGKITATCTLTRKVYLGRQYYRSPVTIDQNGSAAISRNGCKIYSYTQGKLTIDCRQSSSPGSATRAFPLRPGDRITSVGLYFDLHQSTIGSHPLTHMRVGNTQYVTEHVSPGTMITVNSLEMDLSRLHARKLYRHYSKTLTAQWSNPAAWSPPPTSTVTTP